MQSFHPRYIYKHNDFVGRTEGGREERQALWEQEVGEKYRDKWLPLKNHFKYASKENEENDAKSGGPHFSSAWQ